MTATTLTSMTAQASMIQLSGLTTTATVLVMSLQTAKASQEGSSPAPSTTGTATGWCFTGVEVEDAQKSNWFWLHW